MTKHQRKLNRHLYVPHFFRFFKSCFEDTLRQYLRKSEKYESTIAQRFELFSLKFRVVLMHVSRFNETR